MVEHIQEDGFAVYTRPPPGPPGLPQPAEHLMISFATYEEARQFLRDCQGAARDCVIRYLGAAGGGD